VSFLSLSAALQGAAWALARDQAIDDRTNRDSQMLFFSIDREGEQRREMLSISSFLLGQLDGAFFGT
jgi:hypothetical protein